MSIVWKAELTEEMLAHLTPEQQSDLRNKLTDAVDFIAAAYKVGREFKNEL